MKICVVVIENLANPSCPPTTVRTFGVNVTEVMDIILQAAIAVYKDIEVDSVKDQYLMVVSLNGQKVFGVSVKELESSIES